MNLRMASGVIAFTILAACGGSSPPAESAKPASAVQPASAGATTDSGDCGTLTVKSKADFDTCRQKCNDQGRDLGRTCNDPNCLAGIGQSTRQCLGRCDDAQKSAQQKNCYKE